jgi:adenine-specific DNA-methyltransferase
MRYYGCKEKLLDFISSAVAETGINNGSIFCDLFSGTTAVARHFKQKGFTVYANDFLRFSYCLARAYIQNNKYPQFKGLKSIVPGLDCAEDAIKTVVAYLNNIKPIKRFIYDNYCPGGTKNLDSKRMYFTDVNGQRIDAIRSAIQKWADNGDITDDEFHFLLASLIEAVPYIANISGNYAAYLKHWDPRTQKTLQLKVPNIPESKRQNKAFMKDANELIKTIRSDILYLDPPYNERQYAANYFLLELIAEGWFNGTPKIYGKTGMRPYKNQKSRFCQKAQALTAFRDIVDAAQTKYILLSYNDEGLLSEQEIIDILARRGTVKIIKQIHRRYRSINQDARDRKTVYEKLYLVNVAKG